MSDDPKADRPKAERQYNPDRELVRQFGIGCGVLIAVFLCGWLVIALFWLTG